MKPTFYFTPLSKIQKGMLCQLAKKAYLIDLRRGGVDDTVDADTYRKQGQRDACGIESLSDCNQSHFLALRAKWLVIVDRVEEAFNDFLNAGEAAEKLRQMRWRFVGQLLILADGIAKEYFDEHGVALDKPEAARQAIAYAESISGRQHGLRIRDLTVEPLEQLGFTVTNRGNAKLGKGNSGNRNKSQRLKKSRAEVADGAGLIQNVRSRIGWPQTEGGGLNRL